MSKRTKAAKPAAPKAVDAHFVAVKRADGQRLDRVESRVEFREADFLAKWKKDAPEWLAEQAVKAEIVLR